MNRTLRARSGSVDLAVPALGFLALVGLLGTGCGDSTLKSQGLGDSAAGGQSGAASSGGATGLGGAGGKGGANTGGKASGGSGGAGGAACDPIECVPLNCPNGIVPNPSNPCGCSVCAPSDASASKDASPDACLALPCLSLPCPSGQISAEQPCACPICVFPDAGQADTPICPRLCAAVRCAYGTVRDPVCGCETCIGPDATKDGGTDLCPLLPCALLACAAGYTVVTHGCGCSTCEPVDAGTDTGKLDCVDLDECGCMASDSCTVISDACYCPFPQCGSGSCVCGGGKFIGCAPVALDTCAAAKSRVASMCPTLKGATFDGLCQQTDSACNTECLNKVTTCGEASCTFCEACDCEGDAFMGCVLSCKNALKR